MLSSEAVTRNTLLARYLGAAAVAGLALWLRLALARIAPGTTYLTFYPAVMLAATLWGLGPGLLATALSAIATAWWVLPPTGQFRIENAGDVISLAIFTLMGVFISVISELYHRARRRVIAQEVRQVEGEKLEKLNRTLRALKNSSQALMRATRESDYLNAVCKIVAEDCGHALVWIGFAEQDEAKTVRPAAHAGFEEGYLETLKITWSDSERGRGPTGAAIRTAKTQLSKDVRNDPRMAPWREEAFKRGYASSVALPLSTDGQPFGALTIYSRQPDAFSEAELELLGDLAADLAYGISILRLRTAHAGAEEALADSEARLYGIVGSAMDAIISTDAEQRIVLFNAAAERVFRCTKAQAIGQPLERFIPQRYRARHREQLGTFAAAAVTGRVMGNLGALSALRADGEEFPIEASISQGEVRGQKLFTVILRDITERRRAHEALEQLNQELEQRVAQRTAEANTKEARYRSLVTATAQIVWVTNAQGEVAQDLPSWQEFTGQTPAQYGGTGWAQAVHPDDRERTTAIWSQAVSTRTFYDTEYRLRHRDGEYRYVAVRGVPVMDEEGAIREWVGTCTDITARKEAERRREFTNALLALFAQKATAKEYLDAVVEIIRQWNGCQALGIRLLDAHREIPYESWAGFAPAFVELERNISLERDTCCCSRTVTQSFGEEDRPCLTPAGSYRCNDTLAFFNQLPQEKRERYRGNCLKFGFASLAIVPIRRRNEILGAIHLADQRPGRFSPGTIEFIESMAPLMGEAIHRFQAEAELAKYRDHLEDLVGLRTSELEAANTQLQVQIAERRRAQEALQETARDLERSNRDLEQFAYVASHDLQEPLRAVGGYVKLLQRRFPEMIEGKAAEFIAGAAEGASRMERLIADLLAFSRVGTRGGEIAPTDLNLLLEDALRNLEASLAAANASVSSAPLPVLPVDATQMVQLLQNLIGNALKFRGEDAPSIRIGAQRETERWVFSIQDNGIGIEPQYFERIFQIFQRLHTRKHYPGTGIGLAICKKIVERHGGTIWVQSESGKGSTFYFSIPDHPVAASEEVI
jgi:PAS domain S-box-containing protein